MYSSYKKVPCKLIAEKLGIEKGGSEHNYHCFKKDDHKNNDNSPSLVIYDDYWKCEACGIGDDNGHYSNNVELVKEYRKCSKNSAIAWIIDTFETSLNDPGQAQNRSDPGNNEQQYHIRFIKPGNEHRFEIRPEEDLLLRDPTEEDIINITNTLKHKSFTLETLQKAGVKINDGVLKTNSGRSYKGYGMAFQGGTNPIIHNPNSYNKYLYLEGRTDFLTAMDMGLDEEYGLVSLYNSTAKIEILGDENIFVLDRDVKKDDLVKRFVLNKHFRAKFITLPDKYKDLSEFYNIYDEHDKWPNTKLDLYDFISKEDFETFQQIYQFWFSNPNKGISINRQKFLEFLELNGFYKYIIDDKNYILVHVKNNIVKEIQPFHLKDFAMNYLKSLPISDKDEIIQALSNGMRQSFSKYFLEFLSSVNLKFKKDTEDAAFFYFKNCFMNVKADIISDHPYEKLDGYIWEKQILPHDYTDIDNYDECEYNKFLENISNFAHTEDRYHALISAIGYLLHGFKDKSNTRAIILVDEKIPCDDDQANGGTGKSLFCDAISHIKNIITKDGKTFKADKNFLYQEINFDTDILVLDDVVKNFPFSLIFSVITENWTIEKKRMDAYIMVFEDAPKIVLTTNFTIKGRGVSFDRRKFEIELTSHYDLNHTPIQEFGHRFFDGWTKGEWNKFYNFMLRCCMVFLKFGLIDYRKINLEKRKLINNTKQDFVEFAETDIKAPLKIPKPDLFSQFKEKYPDFDNNYFTQNKFTKWVHSYAEYKNWNYADPSINGVRYYILHNDGEEEFEED